MNTWEIASEKKIGLLKMMLKIRHFELAVQKQIMLGHIPGFAHIYVGEEATAVGVCAALNVNDYIVSSHRGHGHCIAKGADVNRLMAELHGKATGYCRGRGGSMHIFAREIGILGTSGIVGGGLPLAVGAGFHAKLNATKQVSVCFFGDGAANQGTFHESINLAAVQQLPVVFVCENNLYATATAVREATLTKDFADRAAGYGIPGKAIDGNDVLIVYENTAQAVEQARAGQGPTLLESKTYRHFGHYVGEPGTGYRTQEEIDAWIARDPIVLFSNHLMEKNIMDKKSITKMEEEVKTEIEAAVRFADTSPYPEPAEALTHVFHEGAT